LVNFINILQAAFALTFLCRKNQSQTVIKENLRKALLYQKVAREKCKMLMKLTPWLLCLAVKTVLVPRRPHLFHVKATLRPYQLNSLEKMTNLFAAINFRKQIINFIKKKFGNKINALITKTP